jgi:hypothetical protein
MGIAWLSYAGVLCMSIAFNPSYKHLIYSGHFIGGEKIVWLDAMFHCACMLDKEESLAFAQDLGQACDVSLHDSLQGVLLATIMLYKAFP